MATGIVKWFNAEKGYGFITPDDGGRDLFVHHTGIEVTGSRPLGQGDRVEYDVVNGAKGPQAMNVQIRIVWSALSAGPAPAEEDR